MINPLNITAKEDTPEKVAATANIPASKKMMAAELNQMVGKINEVVEVVNTQADVSSKLTGTLATEAETNIVAAVAEDNKFVSRSILQKWGAWLKTTAANFTGGLQKNGKDVATLDDLVTKLNTGANNGFIGTGIRIPKVSPDGTISVNEFLTWLVDSRELVIGTNGNPGKINILSEIFQLAVQDNILSGQSRILFNSGQEDALSFADKAGNVYLTFTSTAGGIGVVFRQKEIFDEKIFYPLHRRQAAITSAGAGVVVYGKTSTDGLVTVPFAQDTMTAIVEATMIVKNNTAAIVISAKVKAMVKRVAGVTTVTPMPLEIISNNSSNPGFSAGVVAVGLNLQFFFTPAAGDTNLYTGAFTEIKYAVN